MLALQRTIGNQAVQRLIQGSRPLLKTPPPPRPALIGQAASTINRSVVQLKPSITRTDTTTRVVTKQMPTEAKKKLDAVKGGSKGTPYKKYSKVELADSDWWHIKDSAGTIVWYQIKTGQNEYIAASDIIEGVGGASTDAVDTKPGAPESQTGSLIGTGLETVGNVANAADDPAVEVSRARNWAKQEYDAKEEAGTATGPKVEGASTELTRAEGGLWMTGGIFGMASNMKTLVSDDASMWDRVNAAIGFMASGAAATGAAAQIASTHLAEGSTAATQATESSAWLLGWQEMFTGLAAGVKTMKSVVDLVTMVVDDKKHSTNEWVATSGDLLKNSLETAKGVLRSVRQINETLGGGSVTQEFAKVLPGLDIAISAINILMQGYYLVVSAVGWHKMKAEQKAMLAKSGFTKEQMKAANKDYKSDDAKVAVLSSMVAKKKKKIEENRKSLGKNPNDKKLDAKLKRRETKLADYEARLTSAAIDSQLNEDKNKQGGGPSRAETADYDLAKSLKTANQHRVVRQAIHIVTNLIQIGASIASYVSGPGAPAAVALKAAAIGVDMSLPFFRWVKQEGRNAAADRRAKGKEQSFVTDLFNPDKSDAAKLMDRKTQAVKMLKMVYALNAFMDDPVQLKTQGKRVESYLFASGVDTEDLYALNGQPVKQVNLLVKAIAKREL